MKEPTDGDFVAYLEELQRESAERLAKQQGATPASTAGASMFPEANKRADEVSARALIDRFLRNDGDARLVRPLAASVAGTVALLVWLGRGGLFWFVIALIALLYGLPRVIAALRGFDGRPSKRATVDSVFGKSAGKR
jgi:hypothetical protein